MLTNQRKSHQAGVSLVELMVGIAVGMMIVSSALAIYMTTFRGGRDTIHSAKLNQELRGAMDVMVSEIRRAGFWGMSTPGTNPFTVRAGTQPTDINLYDLDGDSSNGYECILLAYDATHVPGNAKGTVESSDFLGYRLSNGTVSMRQGNADGNYTADCSGTSGWEAVTDADNVVVERLTFTLNSSRCLNSNTSATWTITPGATPACEQTAATGYVAPVSGNRMIETRQINIAIAGHHKKDSAMRMRLNQDIYVRNPRTYVAP